MEAVTEEVAAASVEVVEDTEEVAVAMEVSGLINRSTAVELKNAHF